MTKRPAHRRKLVAYAAMTVLLLVVLRIPSVQSAVAGALVEFIEITEKAIHIPCWLMDHQSCFTLDRFDPTCPQCL